MSDLLFPIILLIIGYVVGHSREKAHFKSIARKEMAFRNFGVTTLRRLPSNYPVERAFLCTGDVCLASDYFKGFVAQLKSIFGGRVGVYESLLERGRREALLRAIESAKKKGATLIYNIRFETLILGSDSGKNSLPMVEVLAYGTAIIPKRSSAGDGSL